MMRAAASTLSPAPDRAVSEPAGAAGVLMARLDAVAAEQVRHGELLAVLTATAEDLMLEVRHLRADQPRRRGTNKQGGRDELIGILVARILVTMSSPLATSWSALLDMLSCGKH